MPACAACAGHDNREAGARRLKHALARRAENIAANAGRVATPASTLNLPQRQALWTYDAMFKARAMHALNMGTTEEDQ
jgi:hypothetical protein